MIMVCRNDQWVALKDVSQRRKNAGRKADAVSSKKYKPMLRFLIRIVRKHIVFDSKKFSQNIANTFIERYMIKCKVNGSVVFVSMSDGVILFLSRVPSNQHIDEYRFVVVSSFPLWGCLINTDEKDSNRFKVLVPTGVEYIVEMLEETMKSGLMKFFTSNTCI